MKMKHIKTEAAPVSGQHTPTPWSNDPLQPTIWAHDGETKVATIADLPWINGKSDWMTEQANAEFIVRACNCHEELLAFAMNARQYLDMKLQGFRQDYPEEHCIVQTCIAMLSACDAAINKATR